MKYRYRSDEEMKDSGVEWIGKIPKDLETIKLKYISSLKSGEFISKDDYDDNGIYNIYGSNGKIGKSNKINNIKKNILIGRVGACGELNIIEKGWVSDNALILDVLDKNYNFKYIFYSLKNINLKELSTGTAQPLITGTQIKNLDILDFDKYDSNKIAEFLDEKISDFDNIISKKEKLIEKLEEAKKSLISESVTGKVKVVKNGDDFEIVKREDSEMKDSGVEWIGKIPKDWEVKRIKYLFDIKKNIAGELGYDVLSVTQSGIKIKDITKNGGQLSMDYSKYQIVEIDDFIMNHMDLLTGFVDCSKFKGVTSPDYRVFRLKDYNNCKEYYNYIFQSCYYNRIFYSLARGVSGMGRWRLQTETFKNFIVPMPKIEEQEKIAKFILKETNNIDILKNKLKINIEKLKEAKQALISEAVTGKIEILD